MIIALIINNLGMQWFTVTTVWFTFSLDFEKSFFYIANKEETMKKNLSVCLY